MSVLKAAGAGVASLLLVPVLVLGAAAGGISGQARSGSLPTQDAAGELAALVLAAPSIHLTAAARSDVERGVVDPRVLAVLVMLAQTHELGPVGPVISGHSYYVKGTARVSNHVHGRAVDILGVDGAPVAPTNLAARQVMRELLSLPGELAPDEIGGPWIVSAAGRSSFTNAAHQDHIHYGWDAK